VGIFLLKGASQPHLPTIPVLITWHSEVILPGLPYWAGEALDFKAGVLRSFGIVPKLSPFVHAYVIFLECMHGRMLSVNNMQRAGSGDWSRCIVIVKTSLLQPSIDSWSIDLFPCPLIAYFSITKITRLDMKTIIRSRKPLTFLFFTAWKKDLSNTIWS